ncbi:MAG: DNA primase [Planctomycetota bacterium]
MSDDRDRVREGNPLEDVIRDYFPLIEDGERFKALCPFHTEKTPSFKVDPEAGYYHCFGCQERGDVFSFVQKVENLDFVETLRFLAERAGISLSRSRGGRRPGEESATDRGRGHKILLGVQRWFQAQLASDGGRAAREYLRERGFTEATLRDFGVGYAPEGWQHLLEYLQGKGATAEEAVALGVARARKGDPANPGSAVASRGAYDAYRGRIMFPIRGLQGKVLGFGGRIFESGPPSDKRKEEPKYLNSPESSFFKKGQILYGLHEGREAIRRGRKLLLMEGYTDVIMAHQAGFPEAVATLGTALTEANVEQVCRHADDVTLVFDGDRAGRDAARKAASLFLPRPVQVSVVLLAQGQDPCDMLAGAAESDSEAFRECLAQGSSPLGFVLQELIGEIGRGSGAQKERIARAFFPYLTRVPSEFRRQEGIEMLARALQSNMDLVEREFQRWKAGEAPARRRPQEAAPRASALPGLEDALIICALSNQDRARVLLSLYPSQEFQEPMLRTLASVIEAGDGAVSDLDVEDPTVKSLYLGMKLRLEEEALDDERAAQLLRDLLVHRLSHRKQQLRERWSRAAEAERDPFVTEMMSLGGVIARLRGAAQADWQELVEIAQQRLDGTRVSEPAPERAGDPPANGVGALNF